MECQIMCQHNLNCKFWTYGVIGEWNGHCVLKSSDIGRQSLTGLISGPRNCRYCDEIGICRVSVDFHSKTSDFLVLCYISDISYLTYTFLSRRVHKDF